MVLTALRSSIWELQSSIRLRRLMSVDVFQTLRKKDCLFSTCKAVVNCVAAYIKCTIKIKCILIPVCILKIITGLDRSVFIICTVKNITGWSENIDAVDILIRIQKILTGTFERLRILKLFVSVRW